MLQKETRPLSYTTHKNKLTMNEGHECETGNHQTLEEKAGKILFDLSVSKFLADTSPKARELKAKINYWDFMKIT